MARNDFLNFLFLFLAISVVTVGFLSLSDFEKLYSSLAERSVLSSVEEAKIFFNKTNVSSTKDSVSLLFVGDIMLDRGVAYVAKKNIDPNFTFLKSAADLRSADLTIGNLEGPVSSGGVRSGSIYSFRFDPKVIPSLQYAGFDVLSLANNHIFDYGAVALRDTITNLRNAGISSTGAGVDYEEANVPAIREVSGEKFAFLSYTNLYPITLNARSSRPGISNFNTSSTVALIKDLKSKNIFVTILLHWGDEYKKEPNKNQRKLAKILSDTGADLIIGNHPHVSQGVEKIGNTWVAWSLGNFVFDQSFSKDTMQSIALGVVVQGGKVANVLKVPVVLNKFYQPELKILDTSEL